MPDKIAEIVCPKCMYGGRKCGLGITDKNDGRCPTLNGIQSLIAQRETALRSENEALKQQGKSMAEALQWCSGSSDFADGGKARNGWLKICKPLIDAALEGGKP